MIDITQATLDQVEPGGKLYLPAGDYMVPATVRRSSPISIRGDGPASTLHLPEGATHIPLLVQAESPGVIEWVNISDLTIDLHGGGQYSGAALQLNNCVDVVERVHFRNGSRHDGFKGVNAVGGADANGAGAPSHTIRDCTFRGFSKAPINITTGTRFALVEGNRITMCTGTTGRTPGIQVSGAEHFVVVANHVDGVDGWGIVVGSVGVNPPVGLASTHGVVAHNHVVQVGIGGQSREGVAIVNAYSDQPRMISIHHNVIRGAEGKAVLVQHARGVEVEANIVDGCGGHGVSVESSQDVVVRSNRLYAVNGEGLADYSGVSVHASADVDVVGNRLRNSPNARACVLVDATSIGVRVLDNLPGGRTPLALFGGGALPADLIQRWT